MMSNNGSCFSRYKIYSRNKIVFSSTIGSYTAEIYYVIRTNSLSVSLKSTLIAGKLRNTTYDNESIGLYPLDITPLNLQSIFSSVKSIRVIADKLNIDIIPAWRYSTTPINL